MSFQDELRKRAEEAEEILKEYLPPEEGFAAGLAQAMNYSLTAGGKRLRPILMQETYRMFGGSGKVIRPFMAGMEMIHTHSLIHDDLPALDNDDFRRGNPTTHKVFGEAAAVLAGDALLNYAYETMLRGLDLTEDLSAGVRALSLIAEKTGIRGMLGGQSVDVGNDGKPLDKPMLRYIYLNKTGALIEASMMSGAILAGADAQTTERIGEAARSIGLAFQIRDDILDVTSTSEVLGKPVHSDERNKKITSVTMYGLTEAEQQVELLSRKAVRLLDGFEEKNEFLLRLVEYLVSRRS